MAKTLSRIDPSAFLEYPEEDNKPEGYVFPEEAIKLVRRLRKVSFHVNVDIEIVTQLPDEEGNYRRLDHGGNYMKVSASQIIDFLTKIEKTVARAHEVRGTVGYIRLARYGSCLFVN